MGPLGTQFYPFNSFILQIPGERWQERARDIGGESATECEKAEKSGRARERAIVSRIERVYKKKLSFMGSFLWFVFNYIAH